MYSPCLDVTVECNNNITKSCIHYIYCMQVTGPEEAFCMWSSHISVIVLNDTCTKHAKHMGVSGHAPPGKFCTSLLKLLLVAINIMTYISKILSLDWQKVQL